MATTRKRNQRTAPKGNGPERAGHFPMGRSGIYGPMDGPWSFHVSVFLGLIAATCLLYHTDLDLGFFHLDDPTYVQTNPWIQGLTGSNLAHVLSAPYAANYSPMHLISYMIDFEIAGLSARAFHASSHVWAGLTAGLVYLVGLFLGGPAGDAKTRAPSSLDQNWWQRSLPALLAGGLFVVHPVHVEAVTWISSRKDLVAGTFALAAMIPYFLYRRGDRRGWYYGLSLLLFLLAVAGKLSVIVLPAILFVLDWFWEKRRDWTMLWDKIPFAILGLCFVLPTMVAQPDTGRDADLYILAWSVWKNFWLLTGFGDYVLAQSGPEPGVNPFAKVTLILLGGALVVLPMALHRRLPAKLIVFFYWVLLSMAPSQVLSFIQPVADRYLYFPSTGLVLALGWAVQHWSFGDRIKRPWLGPALALLLILFWSGRTYGYLQEWHDPRSVWFAAQKKSTNYLVHRYYGSHLQDQADWLEGTSGQPNDQMNQAQALARQIWKGDEHLPALLAEWRKGGPPDGPQTAIYKRHLRQLAGWEFDQALRSKGEILDPHLHFRMAKLAMDRGDWDQARSGFLRARAEAFEHSSAEIGEEMLIRCEHALGLVEWQAGNGPTGLQWLRSAETRQNEAARIFVPQIGAQRAHLEQMVSP